MDTVQKVTTAIRAGRSDQFGTKPINVFAGKTQAWCLTEAPSVQAVLKTHESLGVKLSEGDVVEVSTLA